MPSLDASVFVAGHRGMVGAAIVRRLHAEGFNHIITRAHAELDLADQAAVNAFFAEHRPRLIYLAAAKVGGILANDRYPADFIYQNLMIEANVIGAAHRFGADRLLFLFTRQKSTTHPKSRSGAQVGHGVNFSMSMITRVRSGERPS